MGGHIALPSLFKHHELHSAQSHLLPLFVSHAVYRRDLYSAMYSLFHCHFIMLSAACSAAAGNIRSAGLAGQ